MKARGHIIVVLVVLLLLGCTESWAARRRVHARRIRHARHLRHIYWNPMFPGSHEMLVRQNEELNQLELPRIADDAQLVQLEEAEELVAVEDSDSLSVSPRMAENRRYCRPWTRDFLEDLGDAFYKEFHQPIVVTSLVRTAQQQRKLRRRNRNAAPEAGETVSTHLTGVTADILKRGLSRKQHKWLEEYLLPLKNAGYIDPIEERRQPVFHIVVYNTYGAPKVDEEETPEPPDPLTIARIASN